MKKYVPIVQQPFCCVPACLSMIMYRHGIPLLPQETLGSALGLIVPVEFKKLFKSVATGKRPPSGYGTRIQLPKFEVNKAMKKLGIPLRMKYHSASAVRARGLKVVLKEVGSNDALVCFKDASSGHVCVIEAVSSGKVSLVDPSPANPKWRKMDARELEKLIVGHGDKNFGGIWEFKKIR